MEGAAAAQPLEIYRLNSREILAAAEAWLGWNDEDLSSGLRCAFDALRLYDYDQAH